jgi:hypothetical protein
LLNLKLKGRFGILNSISNNLNFFNNMFIFMFSGFYEKESRSMFRMFSFEMKNFNFRASLLVFLKNKLYSLRFLSGYFLKKVLRFPLLWVRSRVLKRLNKRFVKFLKSSLDLKRVLFENKRLSYKNLLTKFYFSSRMLLKKRKKYSFFIFLYCKLFLRQCGMFGSRIKLSKFSKSRKSLLLKKGKRRYLLVVRQNLQLKKRRVSRRNKATFFVGWFRFKKVVTFYN